MLDSIEITTGDAPTLAVIWMHGLGADGHDFEPIVPELRLAHSGPVRVSARAGAARDDQRRHGDARVVRHPRLRPHAREDAAGIRASAAAVTELIDREVERGIPAERIVLAGFSQGGAVALHTALREPRPLAGVMALSTYLPLAAHARQPSAARRTPASRSSWRTARPTTCCRCRSAESSRRALEALGYAVDWHSYSMAHSVCVEEIGAIAAWLTALPASRS